MAVALPQPLRVVDYSLKRTGDRRDAMTNTTANTIRFGATCLVLLALLAPVTAMGQEYWVSTTGSDAGAGTKEEPFATPQRARDALRESRRGGG